MKCRRKGRSAKVVSWTISLAFIALIALSFRTDVQVGVRQVMSWFLITGTCAALGALLAAGTFPIVVAFGCSDQYRVRYWRRMFAGLTETYMRKPVVADFEKLMMMWLR